MEKRHRKKRVKGHFCNLITCVHDALCRKTVELAKSTCSTKITKKMCEHNITKIRVNGIDKGSVGSCSRRRKANGKHPREEPKEPGLPSIIIYIL